MGFLCPERESGQWDSGLAREHGPSTDDTSGRRTSADAANVK